MMLSKEKLYCLILLAIEIHVGSSFCSRPHGLAGTRASSKSGFHHTGNFHRRHVCSAGKSFLPFLVKHDTHSTQDGVEEGGKQYFDLVEESMGDLESFMDRSEEVSTTNEGAIMLATGFAAVLAMNVGFSDLDVSGSVNSAVQSVQAFFSDPATTMLEVTESVKTMGVAGIFYFGFVYTIAEIFAVPAVPLTASAGYLFGVSTGFLVVLCSASVAAAVSFLIGRTLLRSKVQEILEDYPEFKRIDRAIEKEGLKLMVLLRLSPIFPFALSNYFYGATSIDFNAFFWGTVIGFAPGTLAYVYTGVVGKALTIGGDNAQSWYVYAGAGLALAAILKVIADVATGVVEQIEEEEETS